MPRAFLDRMSGSHPHREAVSSPRGTSRRACAKADTARHAPARGAGKRRTSRRTRDGRALRSGSPSRRSMKPRWPRVRSRRTAARHRVRFSALHLDVDTHRIPGWDIVGVDRSLPESFVDDGLGHYAVYNTVRLRRQSFQPIAPTPESWVALLTDPDASRRRLEALLQELLACSLAAAAPTPSH